MRKISRVFFLSVLLFLFCLVSSCSNLNGTRLEPLLGGDINWVKLGDKISETLVTQSFPPLFPREPEQPIIVTTLVDNKSLDITTDFGRNLQNTITSGFVKRGFSAKEMKLRSDILVKADKGEFMLSRHLNDIAVKQKAQAIVVGTYTMANRVIYLSVRLVSPQDRTIRSSYEDRLILDENSLKMLGLQYASPTGGHENTVTPPEESFLDRVLY